MDEFLHDFDLLESLLDFEGVDMDFFEGVAAIFGIFNKVHRAKASLSNEVDHFVFGIHANRSCGRVCDWGLIFDGYERW